MGPLLVTFVVVFVCLSTVYALAATLAQVKQARVRRQEWDIYAEVQHRGQEIHPPGDDE